MILRGLASDTNKTNRLHDPEKQEDWELPFCSPCFMLHMPIEDVPVFYAPPSPIWQKELNSWLRQFGLLYLQGLLILINGAHQLELKDAIRNWRIDNKKS